MLILVVLWLLCGVAGSLLLKPQGRSGQGAALGFFLGPFGILIAAIIRMNAPPVVSSTPVIVATIPEMPSPEHAPVGMKKCPDCAEVIQGEARKCRYCGADVSRLPPESAPAINIRCDECGRVYSSAESECPGCGGSWTHATPLYEDRSTEEPILVK